MNELLSQKINLRKILTHKRDLIKKNSTIEFNVKVFEKLNKYINFKEILNIASFISIRSEISTHQLNKKIMDLGKTLSFPVIKRDSTELIFIKSNPNTNFKLGKYNIPEPTNENEEILPQLFSRFEYRFSSKNDCYTFISGFHRLKQNPTTEFVHRT